MCKLIKFDLSTGNIYFCILTLDFQKVAICSMNLGKFEEIKKSIADNLLTYQPQDFIQVLKDTDAITLKYVIRGDITVA